VGVKYDPKNGIDSKIACALLFSAGAGISIYDKSINNPQAIERLLKTAFEEDRTTHLDDVLSKRLDGRPYIRTKENGYNEYQGSSLFGSGYEKAHYPMISASPYYLMDSMDFSGPPILSIAGDKDEYGPSSNQEKFVRKYRKNNGTANMIRVSDMTHDKDYLFRPELQAKHREAIQNIRDFLMKHLYDQNRESKDITIRSAASDK
jgi:hypothetical protein